MVKEWWRFYTEENRRFFVYRVESGEIEVIPIVVNGDNSNLIQKHTIDLVRRYDNSP